MDENIKNLNSAIDIAKDIFIQNKKANITIIDQNLERIKEGALKLQEVNNKIQKIISENKKNLESAKLIFKENSEELAEVYKSKRDEFYQSAIEKVEKRIFNVKYDWTTKYAAIALMIFTNILSGLTVYLFYKEKIYNETKQQIVRELQQRKK